ncbi:Serine/threonine protein kinase (fragment) [Planktothrix sp. PCC 11201]|uniref:bifunctional serine/threonine-protein kinase/formylglycine-generating enzyme family protein n=1 Tax=Planktothrix sp. PCC 11201 TaxID=1729650 RepID=UPI0009161142
MSQCLNPDCLQLNSKTTIFCQKCGSKLLLRERYRALKILGQGGFGRTFLAVDEDKPSQPYCVIKQFLPQAQGTNNQEKAGELFKQEAVQLEHLGKHSQIPELFAYLIQDNRQYLVQEYVEGQNLLQELDQNGAFSEAKIVNLLGDLLPVLAFIHQKQVIHRDIKPENIIRRKSDNKLFLVDFGTAKVATHTALAGIATQLGSPGYFAPEQWARKPIFASDLYSLGVTCIHLLTNIDDPGCLFDFGKDDWVWRNYLTVKINNTLGQVLDKLLQKGTEKRFQTAQEVLEALQLTVKSAPASNPFKLPGLQQLTIKPTPSLKTVSFETVTVNSTGKITNRRQAQAQVLTENINGIILDLAVIPAGTFRMGSPSSELSRSDNEGPQRTVNINSFLIGQYAVTQAQWRAVAGLPKRQIDLKPDPSSFKGDNLPVESVTWFEAVEFCDRLSQFTGRTHRLPSEAEWEYACRAATTTPFYFGETITPDLVNYDGNYTYGSGPKGIYRKKTTVVGSFPPNAFGLYDMHGNLWEWCADPWHENYNSAPTDGSVWEFGGNTQYRVIRGGSWVNNPRNCRSANRGRDVPDSRNSNYGFRVVSLPPAWTP